MYIFLINSFIIMLQLKHIPLYKIMISYVNPICSQTGCQTQFFCCTVNCTQPAFGCSQDCMGIHENHMINPWSRIAEPVRLALELPLEKEDVQLLEKQDKQLQILIQELKNAQKQHWKSIQHKKKLLQLRLVAQKVFVAIRDKTTNAIKGGDMANIMKLLDQKDLFYNRRQVKEAITKRFIAVSNLIENLFLQLDSHKKILAAMPEPLSEPEKDCIKTTQQIQFIASPAVFFEKNGQFSVKPGIFDYTPVYGLNPLKQGEEFELSVVRSGLFTVGLATDKNKEAKFYSEGSICIHANSGILYLVGSRQKIHQKLHAGDQVILRRGLDRIQWICNGEYLHQIRIPDHLSAAQLFPAFWIHSGSSAAQNSKLKFV